MKASIAITLIVAGAALIAVPPAANLMHNRQLAKLLAQTTVTGSGQQGSVYLPEPITQQYSLGCWMAGLALAVAGIRGGRAPRVNQTERLPDPSSQLQPAL